MKRRKVLFNAGRDIKDERKGSASGFSLWGEMESFKISCRASKITDTFENKRWSWKLQFELKGEERRQVDGEGDFT